MGPAPDFPAHIAQAVEHFLGKEEVTGSIPVVGSTKVSGSFDTDEEEQAADLEISRCLRRNFSEPSRT